jgi:predicted transport protein
LLKNRPPALVDLYEKLEATVRSFGAVEVVTRDRYALFRTTRIFTDLTVTRDALRVVIHIGREVSAPYFIKVVRGDKRVSHLTKIRTSAELRVITPLLREAYDLAASEESGTRSSINAAHEVRRSRGLRGRGGPGGDR